MDIENRGKLKGDPGAAPGIVNSIIIWGSGEILTGRVCLHFNFGSSVLVHQVNLASINNGPQCGHVGG